MTGHGNDLLAALPANEREALGGRLERRNADAGDDLFAPGRRLEHVYFPVDGVVSLLTVLDDGRAIEVATVGREGMVGVFLFLGDDRSMNGRGVVQMSGELLRLPADAFRAAAANGSKFSGFMRDYTRALMLHISQSAACSAAHTVPQRLARWLLQTSDRTGSHRIELSHQFLAEVLGVRRASVTDAVRRLAASGGVSPHRGRLEVVDRAELEAEACECYAVVRDAYARLMPG